MNDNFPFLSLIISGTSKNSCKNYH